MCSFTIFISTSNGVSIDQNKRKIDTFNKMFGSNNNNQSSILSDTHTSPEINIYNQMSAQRLMEDAEAFDTFVDYEIIIPWVLRNIAKRSHDLGIYLGLQEKKSASDDFETSMQVLRELLDEAVEKEGNYIRAAKDDDSSYLSLDSFRDDVLARLGIKLTEDVLIEISRRYPYSGDVITGLSEFDLEDEYLYDNDLLELIGEHKADSKTGYSSRSSSSYKSSPVNKNKNSVTRTETIRPRIHPVKTVAGFNKTWQPGTKHKSHSTDAKKDYKSEYLQDSDPEYLVGRNDQSWDDRLKTQQKINRNKYMTEELRRRSSAKYIDVDSFFNDIYSGDGLKSIDTSSANRRFNSTADSGSYQNDRNLRRKMASVISSNDHKKSTDFKYGFDEAELNYAEKNNEFDNCTLEANSKTLSNNDQSQLLKDVAMKSDIISLPAVISLGGIISMRIKLVNAVDALGCTALHLAAAAGWRDLLFTLLQEGADALLSFAFPYLEMSNELLNMDDTEVEMMNTTNKSDTLYGNKRLTALTVAQGPSVKSILTNAVAKKLQKDQGKNLMTSSLNKATLPGNNDSDKKSPTHKGELMLKHDEYELLNHLCALNGQKFILNRPALSWAVLALSEDTVVQLLTSLRANPNGKDAVGRTPLHECVALASLSRNKENQISKDFLYQSALGTGKIRRMVDILLVAGSEPNASSVAGRTALHELFCSNKINGDRSSLTSSQKISATHQANRIESTQHHSNNIQITAPERRERRAILRTLLNWSSDPFQPDRLGLSPLHYCSRDDNSTYCLLEMLFYIQSSGEKGNDTEKIETQFLEKPKRSDNIDRNEDLDYKSALRTKCGPYVQCIYGRNALHVACASSAFKSADIFIRYAR